MYDQCPICSSKLSENEPICPTCGFRLQGNTEQFEPIEVNNGKHSHEAIASENASAYLLVLRGLQKGSKYALSSSDSSLGRDPNCTIFLNDMTVSRHHATITFESGAHIIKDEGSFNGVWINNKNIHEKALQNGDIIQLGAFCFEYNK